MHKVCRIALAVYAVICFSSTASFADDLDPHYKFSGVKAPSGPTKNINSSHHTDLYTGIFGYSVPIKVPPGTHGLQPNISISYNSHAAKGKAGFMGSGWDLPLSYIQRDINYTRKDISDDKFDLYLEGGKNDLVEYPAASGTFHTKIETYMKVEKKSGAPNSSGEYWLATTKDGTQYRFGYTPDSETLVNATDNSFAKYIWRWSLDLITDSNGNNIYFTYVEDQGSVYLSRIEYNNEKKRTIDFIRESNVAVFERNRNWSTGD